MDLMGLGGASQGYGAEISQYDKVPVHEPIKTQLQRQAKQLETEAERVKQMLQLLEENPAIEKFINLQRGYVG